MPSTLAAIGLVLRGVSAVEADTANRELAQVEASYALTEWQLASAVV